MIANENYEVTSSGVSHDCEDVTTSFCAVSSASTTFLENVGDVPMVSDCHDHVSAVIDCGFVVPSFLEEKHDPGHDDVLCHGFYFGFWQIFCHGVCWRFRCPLMLIGHAFYCH